MPPALGDSLLNLLMFFLVVVWREQHPTRLHRQFIRSPNGNPTSSATYPFAPSPTTSPGTDNSGAIRALTVVPFVPFVSRSLRYDAGVVRNHPGSGPSPRRRCAGLRRSTFLGVRRPAPSRGCQNGGRSSRPNATTNRARA